MESLKPGQSPPTGRHPEPEDLGEAEGSFLDLLGETGSREVENGLEAEARGQHRGEDVLGGAGKCGLGNESKGVTNPPQSAGSQGVTEGEPPQISGDAVLAHMASFSNTGGLVAAEPRPNQVSLAEPARSMMEHVLVEFSGRASQNQAGLTEMGHGPEAEARGQHRGEDVLGGAGKPGLGNESKGVTNPPQSASIRGAKEGEPLQISGDAVLAHMASFSNTGGVVAAEPNPSTASSMTSLPEPIRNMIERILVEVPGSTSRKEVRIELSPEVLAGTAIRIFREGGQLIIQFQTASSDVQDFLLPHLTSLREHLEVRQGEPVAVSVHYMGQSSDGQTDGRSRERRTKWEIYEHGHERP